ncbi:TPA: hypothetical protein N3B91_002886 [Vibrio parahaemolyticus]|nr:hypothetical protein [Vibrio parahaemolyticus]HCM2156846.1 hypothetical protein [Vibrio parahaemolyticus]
MTKQQEATKKKTCFIVMPIADMDGYEKGHFSRVYKHLIAPACMKAGYDPIRADDVDTSHYIVVDIMRKIVDSDMVICDISGRNPNVMFELGFRQAFNLPTVLIKDDKTPNIFDIQGMRHTAYDHSLRIDNVQDKVDKISESIKSTASSVGKDITSLVQMLALQPASVPSNVELSQDSSVLLKAINDISSRISRLEGNKKAIPNSIKVGNEIIFIGETVYNIKEKPTYEVGILDYYDDNNLYIRNKNEEIIIYNREKAERSLSTIPF